MPKEDFKHVDTWVFDLDNTLYPPHMRLFDQIEERMTDFVMRVVGVDRSEADALRGKYWADYGTTLAGLMAHHNIDPEPYLIEVHDISFHPLEADPLLARQIEALQGRKLVYTNGSADYAAKVLEARGLSGLFDEIYGIEHAYYRPKPAREAFETVFEKAKVEPARAAMFEDDARNLRVPHALGMKTVHVAPTKEGSTHIQFHTDELSAFLDKLL